MALAACGNNDADNGAVNNAPANNGAANEATDNMNADNGADNMNEEPNNAGNDAAAEELSGSIAIDGSGTVYPLMARIAEEYMINEQQGVSVEVSRAGTSAGMQRFVNGETDLSNASREIRDEELEELEANGIESMELKVALDGLTLVTHPDNDWASEMTQEDIETLFVSGNFADNDEVMWSDVNPEWPEEQINFYGPNENHGTYEFFVDEIIEEQDLPSTINLQQEYSTLVELISEDENSLGFFGFGYYVNNSDRLQAVSVDFGEGPVEPSLDTIAEDGEYGPYTRPVFTNVSVTAANEKPEVMDFVTYVLSGAANEFAGETGFAPLPQEEQDEALEQLQSMQ
ncbi:PstS family phosphate ABC transporter substrate-binding protein [Paenalkalicoccus suaedae]|uniref:Phosphate-binding protein n=2 Tax=Paenalkalicoccus suaedae TaxID=2592382 RepID=A0A859FKF3_9BACI|nr:PstS family phosphate ABC transporter substrate-binding protein [Paenalkalicoccus suaedae]